ncbi:hypothetical protein Tco_0622229 [Tanacetum coccineum]
MADHSQKWHDGTTSRNIGSSSSNDGLAALVNKLDNLGRDMKKLKECFHAIQVGCQICEGPHLDKDCPLNEEVKQVRYGEFGRTTPFNENNGRRQFLAETIMKYIEESSMRQAKQDEWMQTFCHNLEKSQNHHDEIIQGLKSKETTLAKEAVTKIDKNEDCKAIFTNDGAPLYTPFYYSPEEIEYFLANSRFSNDDEFKNVTSIPNEDLKQTSPKQTTTHYIEPMTVILGRPLLATAHAKVDILKKSISLEVGNEKVIFKMKSDLPDMRNESVLMIKSNMITEEDEIMNIEYDLFTYITNTCESCQILAVDTDLFTYEVVTQETYDEITHKCCLTAQEAIGENTKLILGKPHWCAPIYQQNNGIREVWASCNPSSEECDGESSRNNEIRCYWKRTSDDEDDIEGIIDYLKPTSYDGFVDLDEEEYNKRRWDKELAGRRK